MDGEIKALKSELALLKLQFSKRVEAVENRLNSLLEQENWQITHQVKNPTQVEENTPFAKQEAAPEVVQPKAINVTSDGDLVVKKPAKKSTYSKPSFISLFFQTVLSSLFDWLSPITKIYTSYKERGMLGIFILTIVGLGLTLAGFGYLMQLLIGQLGAGSKSLFMCIAAIFVVGLGITLKIKTRFGEFATSIVTLGVLLSYSTVYFSGSVYGILPSPLVLILYLAIALACHALALLLDTKIVAALGIIGIATMPILSNAISIDSFYYLLSLAFVISSGLILAYRHLGQWLAHLSLAFTLISLDWVIGYESIIISVWIIELFYLIFFAYIIMSLLQEKTSTNQTLIFLAALAGSTTLIFFQATGMFTTQMGFSFALNMLIATGASVFFYKVKRELTPFFILLSALWGVLTIISAISDAYWGIAWAVEGILLLSIGRRYRLSAVFNQGQILTAIALLYSWSAIVMYFPLPALKSVDGWVTSITIVAIIAIWQRLINNTEVFNDTVQNKIKPFLQLLEVIWGSILLIASANIWLGNWTGAIVIVLQLILMFRAKNCKLVTIEVFAAMLILVPLFYIYQGLLISDSYRFIMLPLFAKLAVISAFAQLWLWSAFQRKYHPDSAIKHFAESTRILFYLLIPICWVASVIYRFDEDALIFLWLSPLIALLLARKINHPLLSKEAKILTGLTSLAFVTIIGQLTFINSVLALIGFTSYYAIAYFLNRKNADHLYQFTCSWGILSLGFAIPNTIFFHTNSLLYCLIIAAIYWIIALNTMNLSSHLKRNETFITIMNLLLVIGAWQLTPLNPVYALVPALFLATLLYKKESKFKSFKLGGFFKPNEDLFLHSIAAITYIDLFSSLSGYRADLLIAPILAVHGAIILFLKDRRITTVRYSFGLILLGIIKLAMVDAANALLWQKVILFTGIGVFILAASFWYQKLVSKVEVNM